jgi:hypothetical protein
MKRVYCNKINDFRVLNRMFKVIMGGKSEILSESFNGTPDWI